MIGHLVEWIPRLLTRAGLYVDVGPDLGPAAQWQVLADRLQGFLDTPTIAGRQFDAGPPGTMTVEYAIGRLMLGDVLVHTWDLARGAGLDEQLDETCASEMLHAPQAIDEMLRSSGHYGPKVVLDDDADTTTRLVAFTGRDPSWPRPAPASGNSR